METQPPLKVIHVNRLRFDPQNPRLMASTDWSDESTVLKWMLQDATLVELMGSIGEHGYFSGEPLLVVPANEGTYTVIEGNRRLAAVKLLLDPQLAPARKQSVKAACAAAKEHPDKVPVLVYTKRDEILDYLGYRHVTGIRPWEPLEKARYLQQLKTMHAGISSQDLARAVGSRADYVDRLLTGLAVFDVVKSESFYNIPGLNEPRFEFSLLTTALAYNNIVDFLGLQSGRDATLEGLDRTRIQELIEWLFAKPDGKKSRIGESRNLEELSKVVASADGLQSFRDGASLEAAAQIAGGTDAALVSYLSQARSHLQMASQAFAKSGAASESDLELLEDIRKLAQGLLDAIRASRDTSISAPAR